MATIGKTRHAIRMAAGNARFSAKLDCRPQGIPGELPKQADLRAGQLACQWRAARRRGRPPGDGGPGTWRICQQRVDTLPAATDDTVERQRVVLDGFAFAIHDLAPRPNQQRMAAREIPRRHTSYQACGDINISHRRKGQT